MPPLYTSDRLLLRNWHPDTDAEAAFAIYGDSEVMHYIGAGQTEPDVAAVRDRLQKRLAQLAELNDGSGFWAIVERSSNLPVGSALLKRLPDAEDQPTAEWEIGWHLRRSAWGKGYATEAGRALIDYGFRVLRLPVLYAVADPENWRSIAVMQRLGMVDQGQTDRYYGQPLALFQILQQAQPIATAFL